MQKYYTFLQAITSISHNTALGSSFTITQERAGLLTKYLAYTSLNLAKSFMFAIKQIVFLYIQKSPYVYKG